MTFTYVYDFVLRVLENHMIYCTMQPHQKGC